MKHTTIQGDTFDLIAKQYYGDESLLGEIVAANPDQMDTLVFPAGVVIEVPELTEELLEVNTIPPWRRGSS